MSTKAAETYEEEERKIWIDCKICAGRFVDGGTILIEKPDGVCIWCYTRNCGRLYRRYMALFNALELVIGHHYDDGCFACKTYDAARSVMYDQPIETTPPEGKEE